MKCDFKVKLIKKKDPIFLGNQKPAKESRSNYWFALDSSSNLSWAFIIELMPRHNLNKCVLIHCSIAKKKTNWNQKKNKKKNSKSKK